MTCLVSLCFFLSVRVGSTSASVVNENANIGISHDIAITMRDGIVTYADIYVPTGKDPFPVILSRVPYGKQSDYIGQPEVGKFWASRGYAYVSQNVRGRFGSEGRFAAYYDRQEDRDGHDTVE